MTRTLRQRIDSANPFVVDMGIAVGLAVFSSLQIWATSAFAGHGGPLPPGANGLILVRQSPTAGVYALAMLCFLPLAFRRKAPWVALVLSGGFAVLYAILPSFPPAFTMLAPMIAIYTVTANASHRRVGIISLIVAAVVAAVPLIAISGNAHWLREGVSTIVLLAAATLLGDSERSRRDYVQEVERRAEAAELTREQEARRRVDEERIRIAREVHDVLAHSLSIVAVQAAAAESLVDREPARAKESIGHIRSTAKQSLAEMRSMLSVLRTPEGDAPLAPAHTIAEVERLVRQVREAGFDVSLETRGDLATLPAFAAVSAYRIVQEALTNAVRHAAPRRIDVSVCVSETALELSVIDDGTGTSAEDPERLGGHGIRGMRERVEALAGTFAAGPRAEGGFGVTASIPLRRAS